MIEQLEEHTISVRYKDIVLAWQRAYYQKKHRKKKRIFKKQISKYDKRTKG